MNDRINPVPIYHQFTMTAAQRIIAAIERLGDRIVSALSDLQTQVAQTVSVEAQAVTEIQSLAQQLVAAQAANDDAAVETLVGQLNTSATALAAAVTAAAPLRQARPPLPRRPPPPESQESGVRMAPNSEF